MDLSLPDAALADYLQQHVPGFRGPLGSSKFKGGQSNPTYLIEAASGRYVLRRKPPGALLASAHAVDREFRVLRALHGGPVPVAAPLHLCTDESVIGSMFYLMEYVDGRICWDPALPGLEPAQRGAHYQAMVATLAALHRVDVAAVGLADYGKPGNYFARQLSRWSEQYQASRTRDIPAMDALIERLPARCPADDGVVALTHGDYRIDNLMFAPEAPRVVAVVDWELSTLGHPLADLGYLCMALRLPRNPALPGLGGMDRGELGIPSEAEMLARYSELSGRPIPADWNFVLAFSYFRLAAIAQGVAKRVQLGNASSEQAAQAGAMTSLLADAALRTLS
jgi:aminoglycoside phosphotransferase (APT) family kinase protein